jgi:hypothetical protein
VCPTEARGHVITSRKRWQGGAPNHPAHPSYGEADMSACLSGTYVVKLDHLCELALDLLPRHATVLLGDDDAGTVLGSHVPR